MDLSLEVEGPDMVVVVVVVVVGWKIQNTCTCWSVGGRQGVKWVSRERGTNGQSEMSHELKKLTR